MCFIKLPKLGIVQRCSALDSGNHISSPPVPFPSLHKPASSAALGVLGTVFVSLGDGGESGHFGCPTFSREWL